ncbi:LuxR C-terminal-related transcriptional regulator [Demequina sp.]|uniref:LuxR C-terminal-related transcriptional regulator n=1 Tax=Demequina sp. TaxID=2050685 RepID=UPI003A868780
MSAASVPDVDALVRHRAREEEIARALHRVRSGHGAIVWHGEPGMGSSSLLDAVAESLRLRRDRTSVLVRVAPARPGHERTPASLVLALLESLGAAPRQAPTGGHDDLEAQLIGALAGRTLAVVADDIDALEPGVADFLLDLATGEGGVALIASASGALDDLRLPYGVDVRELEPMRRDDALVVLAKAGCGPVAPHVAERLVDRLAGNPACMIQTARLLTAEHLSGGAVLPDPLPLGSATAAVLAPAVAALTSEDLRILLIASAMVVDRVEILADACEVGIARLTSEPIAAHLVLTAGRFRFVDQRLRTLVHAEASLTQRTAAHVAIQRAHAAAGDDDLATWHRALHSLEGDPTVVEPLLALSVRHLRHGDCEWAYAVAREAVGHASGPARLAAIEAAGVAAMLAGHMDDAAHWLPHVARGGDLAARARTLLAVTMTQTMVDGRIPDELIERTVADALHEAAPPRGSRAMRRDVARGLAAAACLHIERGAPSDARRMADLAARVSQGAGCEGVPALARTWLALCSSGTGSGDELPMHPSHADDETLIAIARGVDLMARDQCATAARLLASTAADLAPMRSTRSWFDGPERAATPLVEAHLRVVQALVEFRAGDLVRARATLHLACGVLPVGYVLAGLGITLGRRLDLLCNGEVSPTFEALETTSVCRSLAPVRQGKLVDRALAAALAGEFVHAAAVLELVAEREATDTAAALGVPGLDAAEAWAMAGRERDAANAAEKVKERGGVMTPAARVLARARAALAVTNADELWDRVVAANEAALAHESPYEQARTELSIARALARHGERERADTHYLAAVDLFEQAGATSWTTAVRAEADAVNTSVGQAASGALHDREDATSVPAEHEADSAQLSAVLSETDLSTEQLRALGWDEPLTAREREVASLVVQGLSNREVARELYMSIRTVEVHLGRVYRKLGLRSRVELVMFAHRS